MLEQREMEPGKIRQIVWKNNDKLVEREYQTSNIMTIGQAIHVLVSHQGSTAGNGALIRNVYAQSCTDPCLTNEGVSISKCTRFIDHCGKIPIRNQQIGSITIPLNYLISMEIRTKSLTRTYDRSIIHISDDDYIGRGDDYAGKRLFGLWLHANDVDFWLRYLDQRPSPEFYGIGNGLLQQYNEIKLSESLKREIC